jgi:tetratricopeptide (TPR) repeat protein
VPAQRKSASSAVSLRRFPLHLSAFLFFKLAALPVAARAQDAHHDHGKVAAIPAAILERPVTLKKGIGNLHEEVTTRSPQAQAYYDQGLNYLHAFDWIEAARAFHQATRLDPSLAMAYIGLSNVHVAMLNIEAASAANHQAQKFTDKVSDRERTRLAINDAQIKYLTDPNSDLQKYFAYRKMITDALAATPSDPWLWILRGFADEGSPSAHGQGGAADTIAFYQTALTNSPDNSAAHHYLAHTYENIGLAQQALVETEAFIRFAPEIPHAHHMRGHELRRLGRTQEAIAEFLKAAELESSYYESEKIPAEYDWHHAHNLSLLALSYESLGQMKSAEKFLREAFALPVYTDIAEYNRREWPDFLLNRNRNEEALNAAETLIAKSKTPMGRFAGHTLAGRAQLAMNNLPAAKEELAAAELELQQVPTDRLGSLPNAAELRVEIRLREGNNTPEAEAALEQIAQTIQQMSGPDSWIEALFELQSIAQIAQQTNNWPLAQFMAEQITAHDPTYAGGFYILGQVAEHNGDAAAAHQNFQKAADLWAHADPELPELLAVRNKLGSAK